MAIKEFVVKQTLSLVGGMSDPALYSLIQHIEHGMYEFRNSLGGI